MLEHLERAGGRYSDRYDVKVSDWLQPFTVPAPFFDVALLGVPLSKTSLSHSAAFRMPDAVRAAFQIMTPYSVEHRVALNEALRMVDLGNVRMHPTDLPENHRLIESVVQEYARAFGTPREEEKVRVTALSVNRAVPRLVILGGDHSITGATVPGYVKGTGRRLGIIHFDAHHDVRNLEDGGRTNGTPFRTILTSGSVDGHRIVQIGLRDFANAKVYHEFVLEHGVTVFTARDVFRRGIESVVDHALEVAGHETDAIYVSFDLDVLDPSFVPGVPAPVPCGLSVWDAMTVLERLGKEPKVEVLDVVCADPAQDFRDLTTRVSAHLLLTFLTGMALQRAEVERRGDGSLDGR